MRKSRASFFASAFSFFVFFLAPSQVLSMSCEGSLTAAELRKMLLEISSAPSEARPAIERTFTERLSEFRRKFLSNLKGLSPDQQDRQWQRFLEDLQTIAPLFRLSPKPLLPVLPIKTPLLEDVIKEISIGRSSKEDGKETALILLSDGKAKCWDESHSAILFDCQAPAISGDVHPQDVVKILKTRGAFSALKKDGSVVCWGDAK